MIYLCIFLYLGGYCLMLSLMEDPGVHKFPGITDYLVSIFWPFMAMWWLGLRIVRKIKNNKHL
jgi:hypothetical protein